MGPPVQWINTRGDTWQFRLGAEQQKWRRSRFIVKGQLAKVSAKVATKITVGAVVPALCTTPAPPPPAPTNHRTAHTPRRCTRTNTPTCSAVFPHRHATNHQQRALRGTHIGSINATTQTDIPQRGTRVGRAYPSSPSARRLANGYFQTFCLHNVEFTSCASLFDYWRAWYASECVSLHGFGSARAQSVNIHVNSRVYSRIGPRVTNIRG